MLKYIKIIDRVADELATLEKMDSYHFARLNGVLDTVSDIALIDNDIDNDDFEYIMDRRHEVTMEILHKAW